MSTDGATGENLVPRIQSYKIFFCIINANTGENTVETLTAYANIGIHLKKLVPRMQSSQIFFTSTVKTKRVNVNIGIHM